MWVAVSQTRPEMILIKQQDIGRDGWRFKSSDIGISQPTSYFTCTLLRIQPLL